MLGINKYAVTKIAKAYIKGGEKEVESLRWGGSAPIKNHFLTQAEMDYIVSRETQNLQVGMSMNARAIFFTKYFNRPINVKFLRELYRGRGITLQMPQTRTGPKKLDTMEQQLMKITQL